MSPPPQPLTAEAVEARGRARETLARTSALSLSEDFAWFLRESVGAEITAANAKAVSVASTDRERDNAAHVHAAMLRIRGWVEENLAASQSAVNTQA